MPGELIQEVQATGDQQESMDSNDSKAGLINGVGNHVENGNADSDNEKLKEESKPEETDKNDKDKTDKENAGNFFYKLSAKIVFDHSQLIFHECQVV